MKKIWIVSLLLLGCFAARAQAPAPLKGRIAVSVPRVDMRLSYAEYDKAFSGDLRTAQTDLEGRYHAADDDKIYAVTLHRRDDAAGAPALASFFILPGEQLEVLGLFQDGDTFDWRVKGSPVFEADYEYGRKYRREEAFAPATLRRQNLAGEWDDLSPERQRQLNAELRLLDRRHQGAPLRLHPREPLVAAVGLLLHLPALPDRRGGGVLFDALRVVARRALCARFSTSSARCTSGFSTPDTILK